MIKATAKQRQATAKYLNCYTVRIRSNGVTVTRSNSNGGLWHSVLNSNNGGRERVTTDEGKQSNAVMSKKIQRWHAVCRRFCVDFTKMYQALMKACCFV